jgi:aspartyl-tRNA(Asn)/glutamyl-tRNA(Gln) amidotransferase subunit A
LSPLDYARALRLRKELLSRIGEVMAGNDLIATPTLPIPAVPIDRPSIQVRREEIQAVNVNSRFTRFAAFTGQPAISVPCGFTSDNLPVGLQLMGLPWREDQVLQAAHAYEQATDWHKRRPPIE